MEEKITNEIREIPKDGLKMGVSEDAQKELLDKFKMFFERERYKFLKAETCNDVEEFAKLCFVKGAEASISCRR